MVWPEYYLKVLLPTCLCLYLPSDKFIKIHDINCFDENLINHAFDHYEM